MAQQPLEVETSRLRRVYQSYAADADARARWDPDQPGNRLIEAERAELLWAALDGVEGGRGEPLVLVDLGCGEGRVLASIAERDAPGRDQIGIGIELLETRLTDARAQHSSLPLIAAHGVALPLVDDSVDVLVVFTVFSSILDRDMASQVAAEIRRVVRPTGMVIWYDLRRDNPRNREVRGLSAAEVADLFPGWPTSLHTCTVLPPLARPAARVSTRSYAVLRRAAFLHSHLFGVIRGPDAIGSGAR